MRQFYLINGVGKEYSLMEIGHWLYEPKGLGARFASKYEQLDANFLRTSRITKPEDIAGKIIFSGNSNSGIYEKYTEFIKFIAREPLTLRYFSDNEYRVSVDVIEIGKTEIDKNGTLECQVKFKRLSRWYKDVLIHNEGNVSGGKTYDYTYPYTYIDMEPETIIIESDSGYNSPTELTIYGPCINPTWTQYLNNKVVATGKVNATIIAGHRLVINSILIPYSIKDIDASGNMFANLYSDSDFETKRFLNLGYGKNRIVVDHDGTNTLKIAMEGRIEYETV